MLLSLASELIQAISHELKSIEDVKSFRLTCKQTGQALASEVLRCITINIKEETFERELRKLQHLASASEGSSSRLMIQQVDIGSLSPALNPEEPCATAAAETLEYYEEELKKCLYNALSSLTTARTVKWIPAENDSEWAQTAVMDALKTFPDLQSLSIQLECCQIEIPFHFFTTLRHISVHCVNEEVHNPAHHGKTFKNLVKMISQSPLLESIDFTNGKDYIQRNSLTRSLHQLFESYPEDGSLPPLRLKHLSVATCLVRLDDQTVIRHLRHLTSLSLDDLLGPLAPDYSEYPDEEEDPVSEDIFILEKQNRWGSSYEQVWRTICSADLRLEEITLYDIPSAFLEYIGSYSGLKKLIIGTRRFRDRARSDSSARKFYEALEIHAGSIEELNVNAYYEDLWCFGEHNQVLFRTFTKLRTLSVKVHSSDLARSSEQENLSRQGIIVILIDIVVIYMPQLQALSASVADLETHRNGMCGKCSESHCLRYNQEIVAQVLKYKAPWGCKRLPTFTLSSPILGSRVFYCQSEEQLKKGERLRYDDISPPE
ncbi:hypothetical protein BYT27DRAFT_7302269 [Phlegmacium glaucopus]|nr:hypothetical protein BYT27DRAFT_7302269 [Phlegmacium glaucopus]